jgi:hypothetical protein
MKMRKQGGKCKENAENTAPVCSGEKKKLNPKASLMVQSLGFFLQKYIKNHPSYVFVDYGRY